MEKVITENVIVEAKIADQFDLEKISEKIPETRYNPDEFPGIVFRFSKPNVAIILLKDGRCICTGSKNMDETRECINNLVDKLREKGFNARKRVKLEIKNLIISGDARRSIDIRSLSIGLDNVDYNPDEFPGAIYRGTGDLVALVFNSGRIVCTGSNDRKILEKFLEEVVEKSREVG